MMRAALDFPAARRAVTNVLADLLGRNGLGGLTMGARADLFWWGATWVPRRVWIGAADGAADR